MGCCGLMAARQKQQHVLSPKSGTSSKTWPDEKSKSRNSQDSLDNAKAILTSSQVEEVWREVHRLERQHFASSRYRHVSRTIEPVIDFFTRFSPMVDTMVQYGSSPSTLAWGALKGILLIAQTSIAYFYYIENAITKLGDVLSISCEYEKLYLEEKRVKRALTDLYDEIYLFMQKLRGAVRTRSWVVFLKSIGKAFDADFKINLAHVSRCKLIFDEEVTLAHRSRVESTSERIEIMVRGVSNDIVTHATHNKSHEARTIAEGLLKWLGEIDPQEDLHYALKKHTPGTGHWFLENSILTSWADFNVKTTEITRILWVNGRPGSGKTILSATMIRNLRETSQIPLAYFFCGWDDDRKKSPVQICATVLAQLTTQMPQIHPSLLTAYERAKQYGRQGVSESDDLFSILEAVAGSLPQLHIVVDGLDECDDVASTIKAFTDVARRVNSLRLCIFSRKIPVTQNLMEEVPAISLEAHLVQPDIDNYLARALKRLPFKGTPSYDEALKNLSRNADGMFLFAFLSIQELSCAVDSQSLTEAISRIPAQMDTIYTRILERLANQSNERRALSHKIMLWTCHSSRPLTWKELQYALSWDSEKRVFIESRRPFKEVVLDLCSPLVEYRAENDTFNVIHYSVREFLSDDTQTAELAPTLQPFLLNGLDAHTQISDVLLSSLGAIQIVKAINVDSFQFPFVEYATGNWCHHIVLSKQESNLVQSYDAFTSNPESRLAWITRYLVSNKQSFPLQRLAKLQKSVRDWRSSTDEKTTYHADDLADLQKALINLDKLPHDVSKGSYISNFERLMTVRDLARAYTMAGQLDQGVEIFSSEIIKTQKSPMPEPSMLPWLLNSLGILYDQQGRTELATSTQREALAIQEAHVPDSPLDITLTINELGRMTRHLGLYREAEINHLRALQILKQHLPDDDLQIIWTINTLARSYRREGRSEEALTLHKQALIGQSKLLGESHPHAIWTMGDIARCLRDQGQTQEAIDMLKNVHSLRSSVLGSQHPDTLWTLNDIALLYEALGDNTRARLMHSEALAGQKQVLGSEHAHTRWTADVLGKLD